MAEHWEAWGEKYLQTLHDLDEEDVNCEISSSNNIAHNEPRKVSKPEKHLLTQLRSIIENSYCI